MSIIKRIIKKLSSNFLISLNDIPKKKKLKKEKYNTKESIKW